MNRVFFAHLSKGYGKSKKWQFQGRLTTIYEKVFGIDIFMDEQGEMAVLLDREDNTSLREMVSVTR